MRIVIDMQGAQTESRFRGIGRYTIGLAKGIVQNRGEHEVILALSGLFPETIEPIRAAFDGMLPQENIRVWYAPGPVSEEHPGNDARREAAELIREAFLLGLQPDVIHICSLFEGYVDSAVTSIGRFDTSTPISVTLYDLIPLLNPEQYLKPNPAYEEFYLRKIEHLKKVSQFVAISEWSHQEGIQVLGQAGYSFINGLLGVEARFKPQVMTEVDAARLRQKFGLREQFVLYTGGADERKNLPRLIEAFAALPRILRSRHQLLLAGRMHIIPELRQVAQRAGLGADELCFTGYVNDEELVQLYNLCALYIFPSWHEGFGLPALEAMACGAPVIGANTSSLPEVIGNTEAVFDPFDVSAISQKIAQALEDELFRSRLRENGLRQAKKFCWNETAKRVISAWEKLPNRLACKSMYFDRTSAYGRLINAVAKHTVSSDTRPLAYLAHCIANNEGNSIERQLFVDVSELCQRDSATGVQRVVRSYLKWLLQSPPAGFRIEPVYAARNEGYRYARCFTLRFLGEDDTHANDEPLRWQRGDIFFGLDMQHHVQLANASFYRRLRQDGVVVQFLVYDLLPIQLADMFKGSDAKDLHEQWLAMIAETDGAICISKATADAFDTWFDTHTVSRDPRFSTNWVHIGADIEASKPTRGMPVDAGNTLAKLRQRTTFLCVSTIEPRKRQAQILEGIEQLWRQDADVNLVFVGQQGWKTELLAERLRTHPESGRRLFWLQGISDEYLEQVYAASACLIAASLNEGFGLSLIEAARHGVPIIARDIPVFREVAGNHAYYFEGDSPEDLAQAIDAWLLLYKAQKHPKSAQMQWLTWEQSTQELKVALCERKYRRRQLLVDISELVQKDSKTGIQRVVRSILWEWMNNPPEGYFVEPVYTSPKINGYKYARNFASRIMQAEHLDSVDGPVTVSTGDIFFALDFYWHGTIIQEKTINFWRQQGVKILFMVYDVLPLLFSHMFPEGAKEAFIRWIKETARFDGVVCISKAVADDLRRILREYQVDVREGFRIEFVHLGADTENSVPSAGIPENAKQTLELLESRPSFLSVGTIEPRKGQAQTLSAFESLWATGIDANLVLVGRQGWMVESFVEQLRNHVELGKRLFWLEGISDEYLEKVYAACTCLIAASEGEGFGLPLIEAAQHKLPIIARDIPVFREVAGQHVFYFADSKEPQVIAKAAAQWLQLHANGQAPQSEDMPWLTWAESAKRLFDIVTDKTQPNQEVVVVRKEKEDVEHG